MDLYFASQAAERIKQNLAALSSAEKKSIFKNLAKISSEVVGNEGPIHQHPLGF